MNEVKVVERAGTKRRNIWKTNLIELDKNVLEFYKCIGEFKKGYQHIIKFVKDECVNLLIVSPQYFELHGAESFLGSW
jgi:hypothetical protein